MLFNSYEFLFGFLPVTLVGFFLLGRHGRRLAMAWLLLASLVFYGWWDVRFLPLLTGSIAFNFAAGMGLARLAAAGRQRLRTVALTAAVGANLLLLGYFKYAGFFADSLAALTGAGEGGVGVGPAAALVLPLGISFFTFTQITFLVDAARGVAREADPIDYGLFVTYFPHLMAGPVLHHGEMMPQFARPGACRPCWEDMAAGLVLLALGLVKKAVLADGVAPHADAAFAAAAAAGGTMALLQAWGGALAYTLQLYFDFSGYSDMALGLALMMGIRLPLNFRSPLKATSIIDFWRRWHITLSRLLRDYLYIPLGGGRRGAFRRQVNLFITMLLGGLWHGAAWTFVLWGGLHGLFLAVNHGWRAIRRAAGLSAPASNPFAAALGRVAAWAVTFVCVVTTFALFRAADFDSAMAMLTGMAGVNGVSLPSGVLARLGEVGDALTAAGVTRGGGGGGALLVTWLWVAGLLGLALMAPGMTQVMVGVRFALDTERDAVPIERPSGPLRFRPGLGWGVAAGLATAAGILALPRVTAFLYWQF